jgi:hypothetical protein
MRCSFENHSWHRKEEAEVLELLLKQNVVFHSDYEFVDQIRIELYLSPAIREVLEIRLVEMTVDSRIAYRDDSVDLSIEFEHDCCRIANEEIVMAKITFANA